MQKTTQPTTQIKKIGYTLSSKLLALIPLIPIIFLLFFFSIPQATKQELVSLAGNWKYQAGNNISWKTAQFDDSSWKDYALPSNIWQTKIKAKQFWLRKRFVLKPNLESKNLLLAAAATGSSVFRIYINGQFAGEFNLYAKNNTLESFQSFKKILIKKEWLKRDLNLIAMQVKQSYAAHAGISDSRFYIGEQEALQDYIGKNNFVTDFFQYGLLFFTIFVMAVMVALFINDRKAADRYKYIATGLLGLGAFLYNLTVSSAFISQLNFSIFSKIQLLAAATMILCIAITEFYEFYFIEKISLLGKSNRYISGAAILLTLIIQNDIVNHTSYKIFFCYFFAIILYLIFLSLRESLFRKQKKYCLIIALPAIFGAITFVTDLLSSMQIINMPLLFGVTVSNAAIAATLVMVIDFINISKTNRQLSITLAELNKQLEQKVIKRTNELKEAHDALWGEMQLAKKIQTVLLPENPRVEGYELAACMVPADEVGGDYYDIINAKGKDWLVIGDVSGHGVPAGLVMMMAQTAIHVVLDAYPDLPPSKLLGIINKTIARNIKQLGEDKYMTITVLSADQDGGFSFAGLHQDIMIYRAATDKVECIETKGMWIGIMDDINAMLTDETLLLQKNDTMFIYTDGVTEATKNEEMYGEERLMQHIKTHQAAGPTVIRDTIIDELKGWQCSDDVTFVAIKKLG